MNEIIISNIVRKNDVNFRIFYAKEHKIVLTAMDYEKIAVKEITLDVVVNRTLEELEEFFIKYNPDKLDNIYNNKSYDNEADIIIYNNLTHKIQELAEEFYKLTTQEAYNLLKDLLSSLIKVSNDILKTSDKLHDKEWSIFKELEAFIEDDDKTELLNTITTHLDKRNKVGYCQKLLGTYLSNSGVVLRKNTGDTYILDKNHNVYKSINHDELMMKLIKEIGKNIINDKDLEEAIGYLDKRLEAQPNKIRFENGIYDIKKHELVTLEEPILTLVELNYNYNPTAKSTYLKQFLETSLAKKTKKETADVIKGFKQLIGYTFVSGNPRNVLLVITGISGGGKGIAGNTITEIYGTDKICNVSLQQLTSDYNHNTAGLRNKHLNMIYDSDDSKITKNGVIKQATGNDALEVNPKGKDAYLLPKEEVPKPILICNMPPTFEKLEPAVLERLVIIEFAIKFRGTAEEDPDLINKILSNDEEIEWFIYECLEEYKLMCQNKEDFLLRTDKAQTSMTLNKHSHPIEYLIEKLLYAVDFEYSNPEELKAKGYHVSKDNRIFQKDINAICCLLAKEEGLELPFNKKGQLAQQKITKAIKELFIEDEEEQRAYKSVVAGKKRYYAYDSNYPDSETEIKPTLLYDKYLQKMKLAEAKELIHKENTSEAKELLGDIVKISEANTKVLKATDEFKEATELLKDLK